MALTIYNSLTGQKELFSPLQSNEVKMYGCGPTVYNYVHIGNARAFLICDVVRRFLKMSGYSVTYVQNITDIDDKLLAAAHENNLSLRELSDKYTEAYFEDMRSIGVDQADKQPRATEHVDMMINLIQQLLEKGYAYVSEGDVYFRALKLADYGKLAQQDLNDLRVGARIEISDRKEHELDFVLWKAAKPGESEDEIWETPWGKGRPGWHTECTALIHKLLGEQIDIHAGGVDLCFPHHENERAQSEAATGKVFVKYWLHNGFINMQDEKMSKSLGNIRTVRQLREKYSKAAIRYFLLSVHYRQPMQFSDEIMRQAENSVSKLRSVLRNLDHHRIHCSDEKEADQKFVQQIEELDKRIRDEMNDDFNTANAISLLFEGVKIANQIIADNNRCLSLLNMIYKFLNTYGGDNLLGLLEAENDSQLHSEVEKLILARQEARKSRDFARADEIRDQLNSLGIILEDTAQGVRWQKKR